MSKQVSLEMSNSSLSQFLLCTLVAAVLSILYRFKRYGKRIASNVQAAHQDEKAPPEQRLVLKIPDLEKHWPMTPRNPNLEAVVAHNNDFLAVVANLTPRQKKTLKLLNPGAGTSLSYPHASLEQLKLPCDLLNPFFLYDDAGEALDSTSANLEALRDEIALLLRGAPPKNVTLQSNPIVQTHLRFWRGAESQVSEEWKDRFRAHYGAFLDAVLEETQNRERGAVLSEEEHLRLRRRTVGVRPFVDISLLLSDVNLRSSQPLPAVIRRLEDLAVELVILMNDIYSYNVEQARGEDGNNLVTFLRRDLNVGIQQAFDILGRKFDSLASEMTSSVAALQAKHDPSAKYALAISDFVHGVMVGSFESMRYFGRAGPIVQKTLTVELIPRL